MRKPPTKKCCNPLRLLIVEDDTALACSIGEWFELDGHSCDYAAEGREALAILSHTDFDVILLLSLIHI